MREGIADDRMRFRVRHVWIVPLHHLNEAHSPSGSAEHSSHDWLVHPSQLSLAVGGVLELDFADCNAAFRDIKVQTVGLTPKGPTFNDIQEPGAGQVHPGLELQMLLRPTFVPESFSFCAFAFCASSCEARGRGTKVGTLNLLEKVEAPGHSDSLGASGLDPAGGGRLGTSCALGVATSRA